MNLRPSLARRMRLVKAMKVALATSHRRMASCFAGVELRIVGENALPQAPAASQGKQAGGPQAGGQADLDVAAVVSTRGWHPLAWGRELMRRDVALLLCAGIDHGTWAAIQGHGIQVIPGAMGDPGTALAAWRSGHLRPPQVWPAYPAGFDGLNAGGSGGGRRRRRFRGGRW